MISSKPNQPSPKRVRFTSLTADYRYPNPTSHPPKGWESYQDPLGGNLSLVVINFNFLSFNFQVWSGHCLRTFHALLQSAKLQVTPSFFQLLPIFCHRLHCTHCVKPVLYSQSCGVWRFQIQMTKGEWYSSNLCCTDCTHHVKPLSLKLAITKISSSLLDHLSVTNQSINDYTLNFPDTWAAFGHWNWSHSTKAEQWWVFFLIFFTQPAK